MKTLKKVAASAGLLALIGAGCTVSTTDGTTTSTSGSSFEVGQEAAAGDIVHTVDTVEVMDIIPASATLEEWEAIAEDLPADDGFQWIHVTGMVSNNTSESQIMDSSSVHVQDADGNEFSVATNTTIYVEDDLSPVFLELQPTQTKPWEGYFMVPADATDLSLYLNDLSFLPDDEVLVDLGL